MGKIVHSVSAVCLLAVALLIVGCARTPTEEEMRQLNDLKAEVASLERQVRDKQSEKADIERMIADKNKKLSECRDDQEAVKKALGK